MSLKLDFTASGGIDEKLFVLIKKYCNKFDMCLLCKEGGMGTDKHLHCHAIIETAKRTDSVKRALKKIYEDNGYIWNRNTLCIKNVVEIKGALSYVYKDKCVILNKGYVLDTIIPWVDKKHKTKVKCCFLTMGNAVDRIIAYCDDQGIKCDNFLTFKYVIKQMAVAKFRVANILKNIRPVMIDVLAHYGDTTHLDAFLEEKCNMYCSTGN